MMQIIFGGVVLVMIWSGVLISKLAGIGNSNQKWAVGAGYDRKQIAIDYAWISEEKTKSHFITAEIRI